MGRWFRLVFAVVLASSGVVASCQEVVIFVDYRSMIIQSHRVEAGWTYLKVGAGELAVPSASVLTFVQEKTQSTPVQISSPAPQTPSAPGASPAVSVPVPWRSDLPGSVRPPESPPAQDANQDNEDDSGDEMDEEDKEPEPTPPPPGPPGAPGKMPPQTLPPGKMPPQPVVPSIFQQQREPGETKD